MALMEQTDQRATSRSAEKFPFPRDPECPLLPSKEYERRRREEPISRVDVGSESEPWLVTRHADMVAVMGNPAVFSHSPLTPGFPSRPAAAGALTEGFLLEQDPPVHTRQKAVLMEEFSLRKVQQHAPLVRRVVTETLDNFIASGSPAEFVSGVAYRIPGEIICELLGVQPGERERFLGWISACMTTSPQGEEGQQKTAAALEAFSEYVEYLLDQKLRERPDDLIGRMLHNLDEGVVSRDEMIRLIKTLIVGGIDTTANTIALGTLAFLLHPEQLAKLRDDPGLASNASEEVLRFTNITHTGRRVAAREDIEIGGTLIRAGEGVVVTADAVNRDQAVFEDPNTFDIERKNARRHGTFGFGIHLCVGSALARLEMKEFFSQVFVRIPTLALAGEEQGVEYKYDSTIWGLERLDVRW